jgi:hypothetical protein
MNGLAIINYYSSLHNLIPIQHQLRNDIDSPRRRTNPCISIPLTLESLGISYTVSALGAGEMSYHMSQTIGS